jgi:hypothetical protein
MDLGFALLFLALLLLAALFVARPLLQPENAADFDQQQATLAAERERVLEALAELDADWELGKVPEDIYTSQRHQLVAQGAAVLKRLEDFEEKPEVKKARAGNISDDKLEALIASHKARQKKSHSPEKGGRK